jgi:ABC-type Fe3+-hydroxamate transport system substrate-binding protein
MAAAAGSSDATGASPPAPPRASTPAVDHGMSRTSPPAEGPQELQLRSDDGLAQDAAAGVLRDDLGVPLTIAGPPRRVVSLVPSLTEALALTEPSLLAGATDYCTHPAGLQVPRVGGSKWPDLDRVQACRPDLVLANAEENRREDVEALRAAGFAVWVTNPRTLAEAFTSLSRMFVACGLDRPVWWDEARRVWSPTFDGAPPARRAAVPIWRRPWMVVGSDTFTGDLLAHLGVGNVFADAADRYPKTSVEEILARRPDLVVLPDEPYAFTAEEAAEAFDSVPCALVNGRLLTWYGPSLIEARDVLERQLAVGPPG